MKEFIHKISKGSRFSQIYIPKEASDFEAGDIVKVILLKKKHEFHYSKNIPKLKEFKESIVRKIFSSLSNFKEIKQAFVVGSFLIKKTDYKDIDIVIICDKCSEKEIYNSLTSAIEANLHVLIIPEKTFENLIKTCPLTRGMLYYFVSNKEFSLPSETETNKKHIKFLLMMPQDLLKIKANSRAFYDSLRRLFVIQHFLENKPPNPVKIEQELESLLGSFLFSQLRNNEFISNSFVTKIRKIIKEKLNNIEKILNKEKNGKEKHNL